MLERIEIENYRSLRKVSLELGRITVVTGRNGTGKSNLYNALRLLQAAAEATLSATILAEGGMPSALWAGPRNKGSVRMRLAAHFEDLTYELQAGLSQVFTDPGHIPLMLLPSPCQDPVQPFALDPEIKQEYLYLGPTRRPSTTVVDRAGAAATLINQNGERQQLVASIDPAESLLAQVTDPGAYPELNLVRRSLLGWRFYHHFDTAPTALARHSQPGVRVNALAPDGRDLAAALTTLAERGDVGPVEAAVSAAFPGYGLLLDVPQPGRFGVGLSAPGLNRHLTASELSDGQLRFLCLAAALLSTRPPELLVLNEPETSLHPEAVTALIPLLDRAAEYSQVWVTTHDRRIATELGSNAVKVDLEMTNGETIATASR